MEGRSWREGGKDQEVLFQRWICYRRVVGGWGKRAADATGQSALIPSLLDKKNWKGGAEKQGRSSTEYGEKVRALAAMELLDLPFEDAFRQALLRIALKTRGNSDLSSLARIR